MQFFGKLPLFSNFHRAVCRQLLIPFLVWIPGRFGEKYMLVCVMCLSKFFFQTIIFFGDSLNLVSKRDKQLVVLQPIEMLFPTLFIYAVLLTLYFICYLIKKILYLPWNDIERKSFSSFSIKSTLLDNNNTHFHRIIISCLDTVMVETCWIKTHLNKGKCLLWNCSSST